jgi:hypothetical protein
MGMGGHGWAHVMLWAGMGGHILCYGWAWVVVDGYGLGMGTNSKENVGLCLGSIFGSERFRQVCRLERRG